MRGALRMGQTNHLTTILHREESQGMGKQLQRALDLAGSVGFDQSLPTVRPPLEMKTPQTALTQRSLSAHHLLTILAWVSQQHLHLSPHLSQMLAPPPAA